VGLQTKLKMKVLWVVGDNQQQEEWVEVGQDGAELLEGVLLIGLAFECVVSVWEIYNGALIFYVILYL
jgi:hypothetical protein